MTARVGFPQRPDPEVAAEPELASCGPRRLWEIDLARAVAIAMMVAYHVVYDIDLVSDGATGPDPFTGAWGALPEATGSLFLLVAGVSVAVADQRMRVRGVDNRGRLVRHGRHAGVVLGAGLLVVFGTWLVFPEDYVRFGILQAIGVGVLVCALSIRLGAWNLALGALVIVAGAAVTDARSDITGAFALGLRPEGFVSVDYWPLLPWLGPMLIGLALGLALYPGGTRSHLLGWAARVGARPPSLARPGRHSLFIYLSHQLVLIPVVWLVLLVTERATG